MLKCLIPLFLALFVALPARAEIVGKARAIDANTLEIGGQRVRLHGMRAPDLTRTCTATGREWPCGRDAAFALGYEVGRHWITCHEKGLDPAGRLLVTCALGPYDLGRRMIAGGWAIATAGAGTDYLDAEKAARTAGLGLWRGGFLPPRDWRAGRRVAAPPAPPPLPAPIRPVETCLGGTFVEGGVECPAFQGDDGRLYTLMGVDRARPPGTRACICGTVAEMSFCMQGTPFVVNRIEAATKCAAAGAGKK